MTKLKLSGYIVAFIVGITAVGIVGNYLSVAGKVASAPARVMSRALDTDNVINKYEWYHDANASYLARVNQLQEYKGYLAEETDKREKHLLRTELGGMKQSCRDIVTSYNANSEKINQNLFKGWSLPDQLGIMTCE